MIKNKYTVLFAVAIMMCAFLNGMIGYMNSRQNYVSYNSTSVDRKTIEYSERILSQYDAEDYPKAIEKLRREYSDIYEYRDAISLLSNEKGKYYWYHRQFDKEKAEMIAEKYRMTDEEAAMRLDQIKYCLDRLYYAIDYEKYLSTIKNNVSNMSEVSIFGKKTYKNIIRAQNAFYGLENIRISAAPDIGVKLLFSDSITDVLSIMTAMLCGLFYTLRCRTAAFKDPAVKSNALPFSLFLVLGTAAIYVSNIFITNSFAGLGDLSRAVQSVSDFRSCPYMISVGTVMALRIFFKTAACLIVYFLFTSLLSSPERLKTAAAVIALVSAEVLLELLGFKVNFRTLFHTENIIGKYSNVFIFDEVVSSSLIMTLFFAVLTVISVVLFIRAIGGMLLTAKEQYEKRYFAEINEKYTESRIIRHDIKNHITAVAILMDEGRYDEARRYLSDISTEMDNAQMPLQTGSTVLDALLLKKFSDMKALGINIDSRFYIGFKDTDISEYDLCSIFGNILDNAAEAVSKLPEDMRKVTLTVRDQMDMICVFCENRYMEINEDLSTTKDDKTLHGLGLSRVRRAAAKHSGTVDITAKNGVFSISIIMNIKKK